MKLSVVIVSYNTCELLEQCIQSISDYARIPVEIIVVDNHSSDGSVVQTRSKFRDVILIENEVNLGFSKANNIGARASEGKFILFLNSDARVREGTLERLVDFLENHEGVGVVGPRMAHPDGRFQLSAGKLPGIYQEWRDRRLYRRIEAGDERLRARVASRFQRTLEVGWVTGSCLLIRRSVFDAVGGFDERLFMYFEDKDLCRRIAAKGFKIVYFPEAEVMHVLGGSSSRESTLLRKVYRESQLAYYRKHHGFLSNRILQLYLSRRAWADGSESST